MKLKALFEDDGAVSPVIGVILMVAITVILAAVIGTFVLGLGDRVSEASPNAQFSFEYAEDVDYSSTTYDWVNVSHDGGDGVETSQIDILVGGNTAYDSGSASWTPARNDWSGDKITAGDRIELGDDGGNFGDGDTVKVIWNAPGSDKTAVIGESDVSL